MTWHNTHKYILFDIENGAIEHSVIYSNERPYHSLFLSYVRTNMTIIEYVPRGTDWLVSKIHEHGIGHLKNLRCDRSSITDVQRKLIEQKEYLIVSFKENGEISVGSYYDKCQCIQPVDSIRGPPLSGGSVQFWRNHKAPPFQCDSCTKKSDE